MTKQTKQAKLTPKVPVTIITGFLGAGKTSLLNHLLTSDHGRRLAVLVNDFGAVNIDASLIANRNGEVISLENGCICCSLSDGLLASAVRLLQQPEPPEHIIIETSGVSDPLEVARTFSDPELQPYAPLDGVITLVDAELAPSLDDEMLHLARCQIAAADIAIVNKIDLIDTEQQHLVQEWVQNLAPHARILKVTHGCAPIDLILGYGGTTAIKTTSDGHSHSHNHSEHHDNTPFDTFTYESDKPLSLRNLHAVLSSLPQTVFRVKGILNLQEKPEHRCVLQATGKRAAIEVGQPWGEEQPVTQIVFIGTQGGVNGELFRSILSG